MHLGLRCGCQTHTIYTFMKMPLNCFSFMVFCFIPKLGVLQFNGVVMLTTHSYCQTPQILGHSTQQGTFTLISNPSTFLTNWPCIREFSQLSQRLDNSLEQVRELRKHCTHSLLYSVHRVSWEILHTKGSCPVPMELGWFTLPLYGEHSQEVPLSSIT